MDDNLTKKDLEKELNKFLASKQFEKRVKDVVTNETKTDKELEKFVVDVTKNVLIQLYKTMWTRKAFWTSSLKNKST
jgi:hypothetical protein